MNLIEERKTKVSNDILNNLFKYYNETQVKMFLIIVNKAISSYYAKRTIYDNEIDIYTEEDKEIIVPLEFIRRYKGKKHMTYDEIEELMLRLSEIRLKFINSEGKSETLTTIRKSILEDDKDRYVVYLDDEAMEYLVLVVNNYSCIDLEIVKSLRGKYEMALYVIYCMYNSINHKSKIYSVDDYIELINSNDTSARNILRKTKIAIEKLNKKGININVEPIKRRNRITEIKFIF